MNVTIQPGPRQGRVRIPASKSQAHRLLICAALCREPVELVCGGDYLTTVWKKDYRGSFGWDSLEVLHAEILRRGFRAVGDTFSSILASREQPDGSIINYHLTRTKIYT